MCWHWLTPQSQTPVTLPNMVSSCRVGLYLLLYKLNRDFSSQSDEECFGNSHFFSLSSQEQLIDLECHAVLAPSCHMVTVNKSLPASAFTVKQDLKGTVHTKTLSTYLDFSFFYIVFA